MQPCLNTLDFYKIAAFNINMCKMLIIGIFFVMLSVTQANTMQSNPCFCEERRDIKIANCQTSRGLSYIPVNLDEDIQELHIEDQLLNGLQENNFIRYDILTALYLKNNQIKIVNNGCFKNLNQLKVLDLSNNIIRKLAPVFLDTPHIVEIFLNNNEIRILENNLFSNLRHLEKLHLHNNKIIYIGENGLSNLPSIYEINLSANRIDMLPETIIENLSSLKVFDLDNNPWNCDNSTCKFREHSLKKNWKMSMPHCDTPESVKGKIWRQLKYDTVKIIANEIEVEEGQNVTLTCEYLACIQFKLIWKTKQNVVLTNQMQNMGNKFIATLKIYNVAKSDEMAYVCSVEDCRDCKEGEIYLKVKRNESKFVIILIIGLLLLLTLSCVSGMIAHIQKVQDSLYPAYGKNREDIENVLIVPQYKLRI